jgi:hypothetical protein
MMTATNLSFARHACAICGIVGYAPGGALPAGWTAREVTVSAFGRDIQTAPKACSTECLGEFLTTCIEAGAGVTL